MSAASRTRLRRYEWDARIVCAEHELGSNYSVLIFLGHYPDDPKKWQVCPNFVGAHSTYIWTHEDAQEREYWRKHGNLVQGGIPLDDVLARHPELRSLEPNVVVPYLTENLHWRVLKANGEPVAKLDSLEVTVYATHPVLGEDRRYDSITYGRDGGSRHAPSH